ncbi:hypothetical protein [Enterococcus sp. AZ101]|uniref:hypothetical protein n=1 Tax=Enterococcus sp. AZ101 TaxID=2774742 RepID=UPI003D2B56B4
MKKLNKKRVKLLIGLGVISCLGLFLFRYYSQEEVIKANPDKEITIDTGLTPDIAMTIPKDAIDIIEPKIDKTQYKDYVQGSDVSRVSEPNTFSLYSSRSNYAGGILSSSNNIIPVPSGGFIVSIYDAQTVPAYGRRVLYYLDNEGKVLGYYDVIQNGTRFEDLTNLSTYEKDGRFYFSVIAYLGGESNLLDMSVDISGDASIAPDKKFKIETQTATGVSIAGSLFEEFNINGQNFPNVTFTKINIVDDNVLKESNLVNVPTPLISYNADTNTFTKITKDIQIYNPAQTKEGNLAGYPGFETPQVSGNSVAIDMLKKIDDDNYLITTRAYRYKANTTTNEALVVKAVCLYDKDLQFKEKLYVSSVGNSSKGTEETLNYFPNINDSGNFYFYAFSPVEKGNLLEINVKNETKIISKLEYPEGTSLLVKKSTDSENYSYILNTKGDLPALSEYGINRPSIVSGDMDKDFTIKNVSVFDVPSGSYTLNKIISLEDAGSDSKFAIFGTVKPDSFSELSKVFTQQLPIDSFVNTQQTYTYFGTFNRIVDYAPIVKKMPNMIYDITQKNSDQDSKNERLLKDVVVYDTNDTNSLFYGQEWLNDRFQKNPKSFDMNTDKYTQAIDWEKLGFEDNDKVGPNRVTYFATDSNQSKTSTSRWVNKVDSKTVYDETTTKAALRAENFTIKLSDLTELQKTGGLTQVLLTGQDTTSKYGNVLAWDSDAGTNYNTDVKVDPIQLAAINATKKFGKFPLTYTLTKNGKPITRDTYVYVMGNNSEQIGKNGTTIFNTEPISLPWDITSTLKKEDLSKQVMGDGKVVAYDFETGEDITEKAVTPVETDIVDLQTVEPIDKSNPPAADKPNPIKKVHYEIKRDTADESKTTTVGTPVTVYYRFVTVTINSNDEDGNALYDKDDNPLTYKKEDKTLAIAPIVLDDQIVGKTINFTTLESITESKTAATNGTGYEFVDYFKADNKTKVTTPSAVPIQWKDADAEIDPNVYILQYKGLLRFITIPATMKFDSKNIRAFDQESSASKDNSALIVGDNRKTTGEGEVKGNWKVTVNVASDFTLQEEGSTATLPGILYYGNTMIKKTEGTTIKTNSTATTKIDIPLNNTSSFKLKIPAGKAQKGTYQATVNWGLTNAP